MDWWTFGYRQQGIHPYFFGKNTFGTRADANQVRAHYQNKFGQEVTPLTKTLEFLPWVTIVADDLNIRGYATYDTILTFGKGRTQRRLV